MKEIKFNGKLDLNKRTMSKLNQGDMNALRGGEGDTAQSATGWAISLLFACADPLQRPKGPSTPLTGG